MPLQRPNEEWQKFDETLFDEDGEPIVKSEPADVKGGAEAEAPPEPEPAEDTTAFALSQEEVFAAPRASRQGCPPTVCALTKPAGWAGAV